MRNEWVKARRKMGGFKCIRNINNQSLRGEPVVYEHCLAGPYGEIWENGNSFKAVIKMGGRQAAVIKLLGITNKLASFNSELVVSFELDKLADMVRVLEVPVLLSAKQIKHANSF